MEIKKFGVRLRELRKQAGFSQRELADKVGVNFSYLSKIESGAMPPPSEKVILRLAEALNVDKDELISLSGRIPADIAQILQNRETLQLLRSPRPQKNVLTPSKIMGKIRGAITMKYNFKAFARVALASLLVASIGASLWFASPTPVRALEMTFPSLPATGTLTSTYSFTMKIDISDPEFLPRDSVGLEIYNTASPTAYKATLTNLPMGAFSKSYTSADTGGGAVSVTTTTTNWSRVYGYGYVVWQGTTQYPVGPGYGYGNAGAIASITYAVTWTSPAAWPPGGYTAKATVAASTSTFTQTSSQFTLSAPASEETPEVIPPVTPPVIPPVIPPVTPPVAPPPTAAEITALPTAGAITVVETATTANAVAIIEEVTTAKAVEIIEGVTTAKAVEIIQQVDTATAVDIIQGGTTAKAVEIIQGVTIAKAVDIIEGGTTAKAVEIVQGVTTAKAVEIVQQVDTAKAVEIVQGGTTAKAVEIIQGVTTAKAVEIIEGGTTAKGVEIVEGVTTAKSADVLQDMTVVKASAVMEGLTITKLTDTIPAMTEESLTERLPGLTMEKITSIPVQVLFDSLPNAPTEQLTSEEPPKPPAEAGPPVVIFTTPSGATYLAVRTWENEWVVVMHTPPPVHELLIKTKRVLENVETTLDVLEKLPADITVGLPAGQIARAYIDVTFKNALPEDIDVGHMTVKVEQSWLAQNSIHKWSVVVSRYDPELKQWVAMPTKRVKEDETYVYYTVVLTHFSTFAVSGSHTLPPLEFGISNISINPTQAKTGEPITISADITNVSDTAGTYAASLWIDNTIETGKNVTLQAGETSKVTYTVTRNVAGNYEVRLDRLFGSFSVTGEPVTPTGTNWMLIIGIAAAIIIIGGIAWVVVRRRRA